jgi:hypothetical protein
MRNYIIIIVFVIVVLAAIGLYMLGKKKGKDYVPNFAILPSDTQPNNPGGGQQTVFNPGPYTDALHSDITTLLPHDSQPYKDVLALSNTQIVAIHNDWNRRYFNEEKETLRQAISAEYSAWNYSWWSVAGALVDRLRSLGL